MEKKTFQSIIEFKADDEHKGAFQAIFSTFNKIDHQGDVTLPGAFAENEKVRIAYWGHRWQDLPVGRGVIHQDKMKAWVDGELFLTTEGGRETYETLKGLDDLAEFSYGFDVEEAEMGEFEGQKVQILKKIKVYEISPVLLGAGIGTGLAIPLKGQKPYPSEHSCRLRPPGDFQADTFRRITREHEGKKYSVIMGKLEGEDAMTEQAYRYPKDTWEAATARSHCKDHDGSFEAASESSRANPPEDQTGDGKSSGVNPIRTRIEIIELED